MSTGRECEVFRTSKGWFCAVQRADCPVGVWDWREFADCYGPAMSADAAYDLMRTEHANPGGHNVLVLTENQEKAAPYLVLIAQAIRRTVQVAKRRGDG